MTCPYTTAVPQPVKSASVNSDLTDSSGWLRSVLRMRRWLSGRGSGFAYGTRFCHHIPSQITNFTGGTHMSLSTTSPTLAPLDKIIAEIENLIAQHEEGRTELSDEEREYVSGLQDALDIVRGQADRLR